MNMEASLDNNDIPATDVNIWSIAVPSPPVTKIG